MLLVALVCIGGCATAPMRNPLAAWVPSSNHDARRPVLVVLHATEQSGVAESLGTLRTRNSGGRVSAHYLIGRDGARYQLVADGERAWHAGAGRWGTITDVNSASIGIELDNDGVAPFPEAQIASLLVLLEDLTSRLGIPRTQVIAHADMAPARKRDPGRLFPWQRLAEAGFGRWPSSVDAPVPDGFDAWLALAWLGYPLDDPGAAARAFRRHYRGIDTIHDTLDPDDAVILHALLRDARAAPR
ncbi:N-acetylmuramoyl-L-alanine amidase [Chiayiivirga flava]|uniref:N-acetylmuramoyl-L-alanine amidase n=1 Tax=Chiayiivirga flava TaxID=659595 RepID=A0A7W8D2F5_9GAMM|nr:N-acetylmuramoyl-L-alanine amidase [Chiayiivirga flava]